MSGAEVIAENVPWDAEATNVLAIVINGTQVAQIEIPGHCGIEDVSRSLWAAYEHAVPFIHKALDPGG